MPRTRSNFGIIGASIVANNTTYRTFYSLQDQYVGMSNRTYPLGPLNGIPVNFMIQGAGGGSIAAGSSYNWPCASAGGVQRQGNTVLAIGTTAVVTVGAGGTSASNGSPSIFYSTTATGGEGNPYQLPHGGNNADFLGAQVAYNGGGGGAGAGESAGISAGKVNNNVGGNGTSWWVDGVTRGGGGGAQGAAGGAGGGGNHITNGTVNTGGGGGASDFGNAGGLGGSGLVILRYPDYIANLSSIGVGLTYQWSNTYSSNGVSTGYKTYTFTAGTGNITF